MIGILCSDRCSSDRYCSDPFSSAYLLIRSFMSKSSKRIRLEKEIFSKSIQDIEKMFNFTYDEAERPHKVPSNHRLDLPAGTLKYTHFDYDCINIALIQSDTNSDAGLDAQATPILPDSPATLHPFADTDVPRSVLLDLNDDDDVDDYKFELDLKLYLPRLTLEQDLKMIDRMLSRPLQLL